MGAWVVRGRVIRHVDPAIPEPETVYLPLWDRLCGIARLWIRA